MAEAKLDKKIFFLNFFNFLCIFVFYAINKFVGNTQIYLLGIYPEYFGVKYY